MFGFGTFHIFFVLVLFAVVMVIRILMHKASKHSKLNDNGLDFVKNENLDPSKSWSGTNLFHD